MIPYTCQLCHISNAWRRFQPYCSFQLLVFAFSVTVGQLSCYNPRRVVVVQEEEEDNYHQFLNDIPPRLEQLVSQLKGRKKKKKKNGCFKYVQQLQYTHCRKLVRTYVFTKWIYLFQLPVNPGEILVSPVSQLKGQQDNKHV